MKVLPPAVLTLEALAVLLAIPVAVTAAGRGASAGWLLALVALALLVSAGLVRRPGGLALGWAMQAVVIACGLVVPAMFALGLVFLAVWITAVVFGAKADRISARNKALAAAGATAHEPSGEQPGEPSASGGTSANG
jgi:hypothetical protein